MRIKRAQVQPHGVSLGCVLGEWSLQVRASPKAVAHHFYPVSLLDSSPLCALSLPTAVAHT